MKTIKVSEATELQLDWLVARIEGDELPKDGGKGLDYSSDWAHGGPIIEREVDSLYEHKALECWAVKSKAGDLRYGPTILIAAMRCYVASKLGDEVEVPEELL